MTAAAIARSMIVPMAGAARCVETTKPIDSTMSEGSAIMIDLEQDLREARAILEGKSLMLVELRHLRAVWIHHEDCLIQAAMKNARVQDEILALE